MEPDSSWVSILVVDQDREPVEGWQRELAKFGCQVEPCGKAEEAFALAEAGFYDLLLVSDPMPNGSALDFMGRFLDNFPETLAVLAAQSPSVDQAVDAMRTGAFSYIPKPATANAFMELVDELRAFRQINVEAASSGPERPVKYDVHNIVGKSRPMQEVFRLIHKVAATDATVLILGESGTGKELVARAIHHHSDRGPKPLIPVNCGAIPHELLESELFGHEKGAFTGAIKARLGRFELAEGGTVFLDEIGDMSPMLQVKLLRVLQEHQFERIGGVKPINADIRVIAATNQDLPKLVDEGRFREDLYYRLNVVPITIPPLRRRRSDIRLLCRHFLDRFSRMKGLSPKELSGEVVDRLMRYHWPGNVRELENLLERMVILADNSTLTLADLPHHISGLEPDAAEEAAGAEPGFMVEVTDEGVDFNQQVDRFERMLIMQALDRTGWVKNQAASLLRLNRTTLVEKIKKKGLVPPD